MQRRVFRFAEFTFDIDTGTLTRKNRDSRLPEKTARLLQILLERANTLVSREELRQVLWPDEQFVDYDQGINVAVNRLRHALREDSRNPQFLKTIPKRGYSFCAEVALVAEPPSQDGGPARLRARSVAGSALDAGMADTASDVRTQSEDATVPEASRAVEVEPQGATAGPGSAPALERAAMPGASERAPAPPMIGAQSAKGRSGLWMWIGMAAVVLTAAAAWVWMRPRPAAGIHVVRLGIAPIRVQGSDGASVGAGFRLKLSEALSRLPGVQVPALEAFQTANAIDIPRISRELNLEDLLLGSMAQEGQQYDLKFELVRASDATHLAYFEYSGPQQDLPAISEKLQADIFHYLRSGTASLQTVKGSTNDPQAYELYLQGEYQMLERDQSALNQAVTEFQQAIARDPNFAAAYAGMATACLKLANYDTDPRRGLLAKAERYAMQSAKLDPLLAQAHAVLGVTAYKLDRDFPRGEAELRNAIRIDPTQATPRDWLAVLLVEEGRFDEALAQLETARTGAPFWPSVYAMEGLVGVYARRDSVALAAAHEYVTLLPDLPIAHNTMAWVDFDTRHYREAIGEWRQMAVLQNDRARVALEDDGLAAYKSGGIKAYARLRLNAIGRKQGTQQVNDFMPAEWYVCAGEHEEALNELKHLAEVNDPFMLHVGVDPLFDSLHNDPRFKAVLSKAGVSVPDALAHANAHVCE